MANNSYVYSGRQCPICNLSLETKQCRVSRDGDKAHCRTSVVCHISAPYGWKYVGPSKGDTGGAFGFYRTERADAEHYGQTHDGPVHYFPGEKIHTDAGSVSVFPRKAAAQKKPNSSFARRTPHDVSDVNKTPISDHPEALRRFAAAMRLPEAIILGFGQVYYIARDSKGEECLIVPERDYRGATVGLSKRNLNGDKQTISGGHRGLTIPNNLQELLHRQKVLCICEGQSDAMILNAMGIPYIGRPSNVGGLTATIDLLTSIDLPRDLRIIVLGENDEKENGIWPGRDGVRKFGTELAKVIRRTILGAFPPAGIKDVRDWYVQRGNGRTSEHADDLRREFLNSLDDNSPIKFIAGTGKTDNDSDNGTISQPNNSHDASAQSPLDTLADSRLPSIEDLAAEFSTIADSLPPAFFPTLDIDAKPAPDSTIELTNNGPLWHVDKKPFNLCPTPKKSLSINPVQNKGRIVNHRCNRWSCDSCAQLRIEHWAATMDFRIKQWAGSEQHQGKPLYFFTCGIDEWTRVYDYTKGSYFRIVSADESYCYILATTLPSIIKQRGPVAYSTYDPIEGIARIVHILRNVPLRGKPVSASKDWRLIEIPPLVENNSWTYQFPVFISMKEIQKILVAHGITEEKQRHRDVSKNIYQPCSALSFPLPVVGSALNDLLSDLREGSLLSQIKIDWGHKRRQDGTLNDGASESNESTGYIDMAGIASEPRHPPSFASPIPD